MPRRFVARWRRHVVPALIEAGLERRGEDGALLARASRRARSRDLGDGAGWAQRIESERVRLLSRTELLAEVASGGGIGPYDEGVTVSAACSVSESPKMAALLHLLVAEFRPARVLELGTNCGISAAYQAAGLRLVGSGRLVTVEGSPARAAVAREVWARLGLEVECTVGLFADVLDEVLAGGTVDHAFIDGHHQYRPTLDYFERIWSRSAERSLFVFDDIRWSEGMLAAWREIRSDPRVVVAADYGDVGACVTRGPKA